MTSASQHFAASSEARTREIAELGPWLHNLHLPDGSQTAPGHALGDFPALKWKEIAPHLPKDLKGWTALDIGCNAGFYSFQLAQRGAHVTGIDVEPLFLQQAEWAAGQFGLRQRVWFEQCQVYDLAGMHEQYDLVLFMGLFFQLRYPLLALDLVAEKVRRLLLFETPTMPGSAVFRETTLVHDVDGRDASGRPAGPRMALIERDSGDPKNWWAPNHAACEAMLRSSGLRVVSRPADELYLCEPDPDIEAWPRGRGRAELLSATGR